MYSNFDIVRLNVKNSVTYPKNPKIIAIKVFLAYEPIDRTLIIAKGGKAMISKFLVSHCNFPTVDRITARYPLDPLSISRWWLCV